MKKDQWYRFVFEDGYQVITRGFDRVEMKWEILKHGKLVDKIPLES